MSDLLLTVDDTLDALVALARKNCTAIYGVHPVCVDVDIVKGLPVWYLDGSKSDRERVRAAIEKARAARAVPGYERRVHVRAE